MTVRVVGMALLALLLVGCGFRPAGYMEAEQLQGLRVQDDTGGSSEMAWQLRQDLDLRGIESDGTGEQRTLRVLDERWERRPLSLTADARTAEYELLGMIEFELLGADDGVLIPRRTARANAVFRRNGDRLLGTSQEEARLREELRGELARRILSAAAAVGGGS